MTVRASVQGRKSPLPDVAGQKLRVVGLLVTPGEADVSQAASGGVLPFRLRWQTSPDPGRVGARVVPGHVYDRMVRVPGFGLRFRAIDVTPRRTLDPPPPLGPKDRLFFLDMLGHLRVEDERPAEALGFGDVPSRRHEFGEFGIRNGSGADTDCIDPRPP